MGLGVVNREIENTARISKEGQKERGDGQRGRRERAEEAEMRNGAGGGQLGKGEGQKREIPKGAGGEP